MRENRKTCANQPVRPVRQSDSIRQLTLVVTVFLPPDLPDLAQTKRTERDQ
jgi:hypothetical protein